MRRLRVRLLPLRRFLVRLRAVPVPPGRLLLFRRQGRCRRG